MNNIVFSIIWKLIKIVYKTKVHSVLVQLLSLVLCFFPTYMQTKVGFFFPKNVSFSLVWPTSAIWQCEWEFLLKIVKTIYRITTMLCSFTRQNFGNVSILHHTHNHCTTTHLLFIAKHLTLHFPNTPLKRLENRAVTQCTKATLQETNLVSTQHTQALRRLSLVWITQGCFRMPAVQ